MKQTTLNWDPPGTWKQVTVSIQWKITYCMVMCPALFFQIKSLGHEYYTKWIGAWKILLCSTDQPEGKDSKNKGPAKLIHTLDSKKKVTSWWLAAHHWTITEVSHLKVRLKQTNKGKINMKETDYLQNKKEASKIYS